MKFYLFFVSFFLCCSILQSQTALDRYIDQALKTNISLKQKELSFEKSLAALEEAKSNFFPQLSLQARYSLASGGRAFQFPIGDLLNPVYSNLNLINEASASVNPDYPNIPNYPGVENQDVNFLRSTEQETKLRLIFPIYNNAIINNHKIKKDLTDAEKISVDIYKRELVKEVKTGYYNYLQASQALLLFENTMKLVEENLRTSQSLFKNHKVTVDIVYAATAEVKEVEQQKAEAEKNLYTAQAYFNFLLNRNYKEPIEIEKVSTPIVSILSLDEIRSQAIQKREELKQLDQYLKVSDRSIDLTKGNNRPELNLVADYGIQGLKYSFTKEDDFFMGSLVMSWNLFDRPNRGKVQQAEIDRQIIEQQKLEANQQIGLQVVNAFYDLEAARKRIEASTQQVESTAKAYKLVAKKFSQGQANLVELTDARARKTNADFQKIIATQNYQVKLAELERATGTYNFK